MTCYGTSESCWEEPTIEYTTNAFERMGQLFMRSLTGALQAELGVACVFVAELDPGCLNARTLSLNLDGETLPNVTYRSDAGRPPLPTGRDLGEHLVWPLRDTERRVMGALGVVHREPIAGAAQLNRTLGALAESLELWLMHRRMGEPGASRNAYSLLQWYRDAILVHEDGAIVLANALAAALLGVAGPEELVGRRLDQLVLRSSIRDSFAASVIRADGRELWAEAHETSVAIGGRTRSALRLRDLSGVIAGTSSWPVDLVRCTTQALGHTRAVLLGSVARISTSFDRTPGVAAPQELLTQMVVNLLLNAGAPADPPHRQGELRIAISGDAITAVVEIARNRPGAACAEALALTRASASTLGGVLEVDETPESVVYRLRLPAIDL